MTQHPAPPAPQSTDPNTVVVERYDGTWAVLRRTPPAPRLPKAPRKGQRKGTRKGQ